MRAVLVRAGADSTPEGGGWNTPVDFRTGRFAYVPIPEAREVRNGTERTYALFDEAVATLGMALPPELRSRTAHLDPDFEHLTYGHPGARGRRIRQLERGDLLAFYSGLRDVRGRGPLVYALIGLFVVYEVVEAGDVSPDRYDENAHTRRSAGRATDLIVRGQRGVSGRLERCIPFCEYRDRGYRVLPPILDEWGGLSSKSGFVSRAPASLTVGDAERFLSWLEAHDPILNERNN